MQKHPTKENENNVTLQFNSTTNGRVLVMLCPQRLDESGSCFRFQKVWFGDVENVPDRKTGWDLGCPWFFWLSLFFQSL
jgi:hypothetical protein